MEKTGKGKTVAIIILIVMVLGLGGYLSYNIFDNKKIIDNKNSEIKDLKNEVKEIKEANKKSNSKTKDSKKEYTYENLKGIYEFNGQKDTNGNQDIFSLQLDENGLFVYNSAKYADAGYVGNYTIVNDEIHLNIIFSHGSDAALVVESGTKVLKIESANKIIDNSPNSPKDGIGGVGKYDKVVLEKNASKQNTKAYYDFDNLGIFNSQHKK